jgi:hypothetical protein
MPAIGPASFLGKTAHAGKKPAPGIAAFFLRDKFHLSPDKIY